MTKQPTDPTAIVAAVMAKVDKVIYCVAEGGNGEGWVLADDIAAVQHAVEWAMARRAIEALRPYEGWCDIRERLGELAAAAAEKWEAMQ